MKIRIIGRNCPKCHKIWMKKECVVDAKREQNEAKKEGFTMIVVRTEDLPNYCPSCGTHLEMIKEYMPAAKSVTRNDK